MYWRELRLIAQTHIQDFNSEAGGTFLELDGFIEDEFYLKGPKSFVVVTLNSEPSIHYDYLRRLADKAQRTEGGKYAFALEDGEVWPINSSTGEKTSIETVAERILDELLE